ncbi:hypothetical protein D9758_017131 [Tetrapyrgos nigripes]|uniref:Uncharacterized protein n=1 Tax=Tetrapyrgos nigripes TaxID=182062 RepID=A0A8H5F4R6_9AGAR|nr:hypothetical protein D9758_017131 [Tetrapyrgos nigripes]
MREVILLLSCRDSQLTWEDADGTSMTQFFAFVLMSPLLPSFPPVSAIFNTWVLVKQLRKQTHPSMKVLMSNISYELHKATAVMYSRTKAYKTSMVNYRKKKN